MKQSPSVLFVVGLLAIHCAVTTAAEPPYPSSHVIGSLTWHWETHRTAAPGSDLWPVTWGPDGHLYTAWGDGGGFGGTNSEGRVSMGFARIEGPPESFRGVNVNGGQNPEHPASFPKRGKTGGITAVDDHPAWTKNKELAGDDRDQAKAPATTVNCFPPPAQPDDRPNESSGPVPAK